MAGQHIERQARYAATGLTPAQRDQFIWEWHRAGKSFAQIGKHLGMSKSACKYIFDRLSGTPRVQKQSAMCQGCWDSFYRDQLNSDGLCPECSEGVGEKPPPPP
jgi:rubredoxin